MENTNSKTTSHLIRSNPVIRKLSKINESDANHACTYQGITRKLVFFLLMIVAGIAVNAFLKLSGFQFPGDAVLTNTELGLSITGTELMILVICSLLFLIAPILTVLIKATIPVTGLLYCIATGYLLSWLAATFGKEYAAPLLLALVLTVLIVLVMGILYSKGIVKVTRKFRTVVTTLFFTALAGGAVVGIGALIPATQPLVAALKDNLLLSIGGGILMVIIGSLFLLVDFDTIQSAVENKVPKKYEWYASFGLVFSVIWLYFKILDLILSIMQASNKK